MSEINWKKPAEYLPLGSAQEQWLRQDLALRLEGGSHSCHITEELGGRTQAARGERPEEPQHFLFFRGCGGTGDRTPDLAFARQALMPLS